MSKDLIRKIDIESIPIKPKNERKYQGYNLDDAYELGWCDLLDAIRKSNRPKGKWLWKLADNGWVDHICSECGYTENTDIHIQIDWDYCPNCGARMESEGE